MQQANHNILTARQFMARLLRQRLVHDASLMKTTLDEYKDFVSTSTTKAGTAVTVPDSDFIDSKFYTGDRMHWTKRYPITDERRYMCGYRPPDWVPSSEDGGAAGPSTAGRDGPAPSGAGPSRLPSSSEQGFNPGEYLGITLGKLTHSYLYYPMSATTLAFLSYPVP